MATMAEPVVQSPVLAGPAQRKREQGVLVRRSTTAAVSLAIVLTGLLASVASGFNSLGQARAQPAGPAGPDGAAALSKALADFEAAAERRSQAQASAAAKQAKPIAAARSAPAPAAKPAVAVSGGS